MKKIIMVIAFICVCCSSVMAEQKLECFVIDGKEICLTHEEIIQLTIELLEVLKNEK